MSFLGNYLSFSLKISQNQFSLFMREWGIIVLSTKSLMNKKLSIELVLLLIILFPSLTKKHPYLNEKNHIVKMWINRFMEETHL